MNERSKDEGYIVETITQGRFVKVTAFDPKTLVEASVIGAAGLPQSELAKLAVRKLRYVLRKKKNTP